MNSSAIQDVYSLIQDRRSSSPIGYESTTEKLPTQTPLNWVLPIAPKNAFTLIPVLGITSDSNKRIKFAKPVILKLGPSEDGFFAENESLGIFVNADTPEEVIQEFYGVLLYFFKHYSSLSSDRVIGEAKRLREIYTGFMREEE